MSKITKDKTHNTNWFSWSVFTALFMVFLTIGGCEAKSDIPPQADSTEDQTLDENNKNDKNNANNKNDVIITEEQVKEILDSDSGVQTDSQLQKDDEQQSEGLSNSTENQPSAAFSEDVQLTFEKQVEEISVKAAGKDNFINVAWDDESKTAISINLKMHNNKAGMTKDASDILKALSSNNTFKKLQHITIIHDTELKDDGGTTSTVNAGLICIDVDTVMNINWGSFTNEKLPDMCTTYYVHPSLE